MFFVFKGEFIVLRLILLWNPGPIGLSSETIKIIQRASEKVIEELNNYFKLNKVGDPQNRLSAIFLLLSPLVVNFIFFIALIYLTQKNTNFA